MSIGNEIAYRRSARGHDATGSLVFDQERKQAREADKPEDTVRTRKTRVDHGIF